MILKYDSMYVYVLFKSWSINKYNMVTYYMDTQFIYLFIYL